MVADFMKKLNSCDKGVIIMPPPDTVRHKWTARDINRQK